MYYSVCVPAVFGGSGKTVPEVLPAICRAGFHHYELWGWEGLDLDACKRAQQEEGLFLAALCTSFASLTDSARRTDYVEGLKETAEVCRKLGCKTVITQVGQELTGIARDVQHASIAAGLRACVPVLEEYHLTLVIEPLNTRLDHPGYYLWSAGEAFQIVEEAASAQVKVLYDMYHQYVTGDFSVDEIVKNIDKIGHFHMAGYPGRHEPLGNCEMDYPGILRAIRQSGYEGGIGLEYMPFQDAEKGLRELYGQLEDIVSSP